MDLFKPDFLHRMPDEFEDDTLILKHQFGEENLMLSKNSLRTIFPNSFEMLVLKAETHNSKGLRLARSSVFCFKNFNTPNIRTVNFSAYSSDNKEDKFEEQDENVKVMDKKVDASPMSSFSSQQSSAESLVKKSSNTFKLKLGRLIRFVKLSLIITVSSTQNVFFAASCLTVNTIMSSLSSDLSDKLNLSHQFGMMSWNILNLAYRTKELYLMNKGITYNNTEAFVRSEIQVNLEFLQETLSEFRNDIIQSKVGGNYNTDNLIWFEYINDKYVEERKTLLDIILQLEDAAKNIYETPLNEIIDNNRDFIVIYRNGPAEVTRYVNNTINSFVEESKQTVTKTYSLIISLILITGAVYFICVVTMTLPLILIITSIRKRLWELIGKLPINILRVGKIRALERLQFIHSIEEDNLQSSDNLQTNRFKYRTHPMQFLLYYFIIALMCSLAIYMYLITDIATNKIFSILNKKPEYIHWADMRRTLAQYSIFWMREIKHFEPVFFDSNYFYDETISTMESIDFFSYSHKKVRQISIPVSKDHLDFNFDDACTANNCLPILFYGLQSTIMEVTQASMEFVEIVKSGQDYIESGGLELEKSMSACIEAIIISISIYQRDTEDQITLAVALIMQISAGFLILIFAFYFVIIRPVINRFQSSFYNELDIPMMLPKEELATFISELKHWK